MSVAFGVGFGKRKEAPEEERVTRLTCPRRPPQPMTRAAALK